MRQSALQKGPYRPFLGSDIYRKLFPSNIQRIDVAVAILLGLSFFLQQIRGPGLDKELSPTEFDLLEAVGHYRNDEFFIISSPPLIVEVLSFIARLTGNLSTDVLRKISLVVAALTVSNIYLALRVSSVVSVVSIVATAIVSHLPLFTEESKHLSPTILQLLFLSNSVLNWNSLKRSRSFSKGWMLHLALLSFSLSLSAGTKFIGLVTWSWFLILAAKQVWEIVGDIKVSKSQLLLHVFWRGLTVLLLPPITLLFSYFLFISNSRSATLDHASLVSPYFKSWFLPQPMPQPDVVYYGSSLLIRHAQSLGGYLHSHNHTYKGGSGEQQVSLFHYSNNADNEWTLEPYSDEMEYKTNPEPVRNGALVKMRHKSTGKLLRASSAKPPISEQDYDHEVSCTGDIDYRGDSDESWRIRFERGKTVHDDLLCPFTIYFSLENKGHNCKLLSHDLRMPDWGFEQQEVLCVDSADKERSLFFIDRSNLYKERGAYLTEPKHWIGKRLLLLSKEFVQVQFKYDYYLKNKDLVSEIKMENWLWSSADSAAVNFMWFTPLICLITYLIVQLSRWFRWNPWTDTTSELDPIKYLYLDNCLELAMGWFMHYYIFTWGEHDNFNLVQYLPSYLLSLLLAAHTANFFWRHNSVSRFLLIAFTAAAVILTYVWM
ncbi:LANO_0G06766g1_1 [Lachancea nothofagi CBS 11611]|uniref:dolichyl-phosphate-mannose--protein mannosyltransferase n=1 Tax=Lachancea nothofagi CBS 11611 TaxID=1266666 RepID=A0A1G4KHB8_9SACH|nr:LANO_0G06766g1_1 [Lachancea nothofagi CBS 11611]